MHVFVKSTMEEKPMKRQHHYNDFSSFELDSRSPDLEVAYVVRLVDDQSAVFAEYEAMFIECP